MRCDRKCQAHIHPTRIALYRRVEEAFHLGKCNNLIKLSRDLSSGHSENRTVQINVFPSRELGVETRADLEQARHPAAQDRAPAIGLSDAAENLQERRFSGTIAADDTKHFATLDFEA